jgi:cation:H+ antiporter
MQLIEGLELWHWAVVFGLSAGVVVAAGVVLARNGDAIATRTGMGGLFVGMLLMAGATSLPEIVTDVSAAAAGAPDLALGDLFGSSMANMAILALVDLIHRGHVWPSAGLGQARVAAIAIALTSVLMLGIISPVRFQVGWIGVESIVIIAAYVFAAAWVRRAQRSATTGPVTPEPALPEAGDEVLVPVGLVGLRGEPLRRNVLAFLGASLLILIAAPLMTIAAQAIAEQTGVAQTFVGVTLLAAATSLPELATSIAAVRIGAYALAVGNLFGSNAINPTIIFFADAAYLPGPILAAVSSQQLMAGVGAILLTAIALGGIVHGARTRIERGEPDALLLLLTYVLMVGIVWAGS